MTRAENNILLFLGVLATGACLLVAWVWVTIAPRLNPNSLPSRVLASPSAAYSDAVEEGRVLARSLIAEENLAGLSVAVAVDGEIVWAEGFGWEDLENRAPVTPATRFRIGSVTKTITAAAAGLLHERGRLDLDALVQHYRPSFPEKTWPISTRELMGHVAGVRHHQGEHETLRRASCADDLERLAIFADDPLRFRPGTAYAYSTYGYVLVGAVVAAAAAEPWLDFVQREMFILLGMRSTVADVAGRSVPEGAHFYFPRMARNPRLGLQVAPTVDLSCILPAGGLLSTPCDLVRFGSAMISGGLLDPETIALLQTPVRLESGESTGAGLGWFVRRVPIGERQTPTRIVGHGGSEVGGTASLMTVPEHGIAIAVTTNVSFAEAVSSLSAQLADIFARSAAGVHRSWSPS